VNAVEILLGVLVAAGAVLLVARPLWRGRGPAAPAFEDAPAPEETRKGVALLALREIEFDRETGKLSDQDYERLKAAYTAEAVAALRVEEGRAARASDAAEAMISVRVIELRGRKGAGKGTAACPACGPRPEPDALFCSDCGRSLAGPACGACGAALRGDAKFCERCGAPVAGAA
jgi:hypothetical protein